MTSRIACIKTIKQNASFIPIRKKVQNIRSCVLTFQTSIGGQCILDAAGAKQETDLLQSRVSASQRDLNGNRHHSGLQTPVERTHKVDGVVVRVHQGHAVPRLDRTVSSQRTPAVVLRGESFVKKGVSDFERTA